MSHEGESLESLPVRAALPQLGWGRCGDGITMGYTCHHPSVLEPGAVGAVPLSHMGLNNSCTSLQRVLALLVCLPGRKGA